MQDKLIQFYLNHPKETSSCLQSLRDLIKQHDLNIVESLKYGMPCFSILNKVLCYLWTDKKSGYPYILFVEGNHLQHPDLLTGERKRMKSLNIDPNKDIPLDTIHDILTQSIELSKLNTKRIRQ